MNRRLLAVASLFVLVISSIEIALWHSVRGQGFNSHMVQSCMGDRPNAFSSTIECNLPNTTNGNWIVVKYSNYAASETWTSTETLTFPSGAQSSWTFGGFPRHAGIGYVHTTSAHADFHVKYADAAANVNSLIVEEWVGPGAVDSSSATNATSTLSVNVTTAAANEIVFIACSDSSYNLTPGSSSITQNNSIGITDGTTANANFRGWSGSQIFASATTAAVSCGTTGSNNAQQISGLAFTQSSPPAIPALTPLQQCASNFNNGGTSTGGCTLSNVLSGSTVIALFTEHGEAVQLTPSGTETFTCDSGTFIHHIYGGNHDSSNICYVKLASSHATFSATVTGCVGCVFPEFTLLEIPTGALASTSDSSGTAGFAAQSGTYTTTNANEGTFMLASDNDANPGVGEVLTPGNSFLPIIGIWEAPSSVEAQQCLVSAKVTTSSGANTASWTYTNTNAPLTSVLPFGPSITVQGFPAVY